MIEFLDSAGVDLDAREPARNARPRSTTQFANDTRQQSFVAVETDNRPRQRHAAREILYFDIETCPDESRAHLFNLDPLPTLPPETPAANLLDAEQFLSQDLKAIEKWFENKNPPSNWLDEIVAAERASKKERKGFFSAVDKHHARIAEIAGSEAKRIKMLNLCPEYNRIAAFGWAIGSGEVNSSVCIGENGEREILQAFWTLAQRCGPVVGFGVSYFDIPTILARSILLGVPSTKSFAGVKPWDTTSIIDLSVGRHPKGGGQKSDDDKSEAPRNKKLKDLARLYGIDIPADDCDGSRVYQMVKAGEWEALGRYVRSDVEITRELHRKFSGYFTV